MSKVPTPSVFDPEEVAAAVRNDGICHLPGVLSSAECRVICEKLEVVVASLIEKREYFGSNTTQVVHNYFFYDRTLAHLFSMDPIDAVMRRLIDQDYVLISPAARNPRITSRVPRGRPAPGEGWHIDSRIANPRTGELFRPSMCYLVVIALEPFTKDNAATCYVPGSHLWYAKPFNRDGVFEHRIIEADAGTAVVFDSALWHRTGEPSSRSRWSIFNMYGPWFMKPYFRFAENYSRAELEEFTDREKKLLHLHSAPPRNSDARINTITPSPSFD
jgi:hypothetical protein